MTPLEVEALLTAFSMRSDAHRLELVDSTEASSVQERARVALNVSGDGAWWWEEGGERMRGLAYPAAASMRILKALALAPSELVYLFVSDDELPPWPCIKGDIDAMCELLSDSQYFEFMIVSHRFDWIAFDTHHNMLWIWPPERAKCLEVGFQTGVDGDDPNRG